MSKQTSRSLSCWAVAFMSVAGGCARNTPPPATSSDRTAFVAQVCPAVERGSAPLDVKNARLFVEVADVDASGLPSPVGDWLEHHPVTLRSSAHLVAFPDVPTSMPWGQCVDAVCSSAQRSITLVARLAERASDPVDLALRIDEGAAEGSNAGPSVLLDTTLRLENQEPLALPPAPRVSDGTLIVTSYLIRSLEDLHAVMQCKVREGERTKSLR